MDSTMNHPWIELQLLIKEKWLTQKAFATILWKKVSEVNELLKWKRNITIQWDYLLHQSLWTPIKYWILKQVDYDYSLLDIEESIDTNPLFWTKWRIQEDIKPIDSSADKSVSEWQEKPEDEIWGHSEQIEESRKTWHSVDSSVVYPAMRGDLPQNNNNMNIVEKSASDWDWESFKEEKNIETNNSPFEMDKFQNEQKVDNENWWKNNDKDFKERANIFKTF